MRRRAGKMQSRCRFERRTTEPDVYGNVTAGGWAEVVTCWGWLQFERGRERLAAGRMESAVAATLWVDAMTETRTVTGADRVLVDGVVFAVRAAMEPVRSGQIEMLVERGVGD